MAPPIIPPATVTPNVVQVIVDDLFVYLDAAIGAHLFLLSISHGVQNIIDMDIAMLPGIPTLAEIKPMVDAALSRVALWAGRIGLPNFAAKVAAIQAWFDALVGGADIKAVAAPVVS